MKAYSVGIKSNPDAGNEIIFAKNTKEARKKAQHTNLVGENGPDFIDVRVLREPAFDDMENVTEKEMLIKQWRTGWWFFRGTPPDPETASDEEFLEWWEVGC